MGGHKEGLALDLGVGAGTGGGYVRDGESHIGEKDGSVIERGGSSKRIFETAKIKTSDFNLMNLTGENAVGEAMRYGYDITPGRERHERRDDSNMSHLDGSFDQSFDYMLAKDMKGQKSTSYYPPVLTDKARAGSDLDSLRTTNRTGSYYPTNNPASGFAKHPYRVELDLSRVLNNSPEENLEKLRSNKNFDYVEDDDFFKDYPALEEQSHIRIKPRRDPYSDSNTGIEKTEAKRRKLSMDPERKPGYGHLDF